MELKLSKIQKEYLDSSGIISAKNLQKAFKKSTEDQMKMKEQAAEIRKAQAQAKE